MRRRAAGFVARAEEPALQSDLMAIVRRAPCSCRNARCPGAAVSRPVTNALPQGHLLAAPNWQTPVKPRFVGTGFHL